MEAFVISTGVVALAEMGDKSQLFVLAVTATYRKPVPIILGILAATLLNHTATAALGAWLAATLSAATLRVILSLSFVGVAIWLLVPAKPQDKTLATPRFGVFAATLCGFFLLEMGDKTQIATVLLAAKYRALSAVVAGTTFGILLADVPVVMLSATMAPRFTPKAMRIVAATLFAGIGIAGLLERVT